MIAIGILLGAGFACGLVGLLTGTTPARLIGLQTAGAVPVAALLQRAGELPRPTFVDVAVALALLAPAATLLFVRLVDRDPGRP